VITGRKGVITNVKKQRNRVKIPHQTPPLDRDMAV